MSKSGRDRMSAASDPRSSRRRSRVSDARSESVHGSVYDEDGRTERDSINTESVPPLPMKPPGGANINSDPALAGNSADEYFNDITTTPSDETPPSTPAGAHALSRRRTSSGGLSHSQSPSHIRQSRRTRSHSSAREILRLLLSSEGSESRETLAMLRRAQERLEIESQRANEAERRVQEANDRWRLINQERVRVQAEAHKASEELRLYKLQLEAAQQQIARANDMISLTDKERAQAEDEAAKARRLAKKYEMEREIQKAREEGRREGLRQGLKEAELEEAYIRKQNDRYNRSRYRTRDRELDEETYADDDAYYDPEDVDEVYPIPASAPSVREQDVRMQDRQQIPRSAPLNGVPRNARSMGPRDPRPSNGLLGSLTRLGRSGGGRRGLDMDRNVALNPSNAPDVANIIDDEPINTLASPLPPEQTTQINHTRMPVPNFNPDPSEVGPIAIPNLQSSRSPMHPPTAILPDGYIPRQDDDGSIRLPPPHEMGQAPPTPRAYGSALSNAANLPPSADPELPQRERDPIPRDFGYVPQQQPRSQGRHRYQKSVADSEDTITNLSIISPPNSRPSVMQPQLSPIREHDSRYASPSGSMRQAEPPVYPNSPRTRSIRRAESENIYVPGDPVLDPALANRQSMVNEDPYRPEMAAAFSPRSNHSRFSGPKRPSHITTPAPLAPEGGFEYRRPRINSVASGSEHSGFVGTPRPSRSRDKTPAPEFNRSRPGTATNTPAYSSLPEITIQPASRSNSLQSQSRKSYASGRPERGVISPRARRAHTSPMPAPVPAPMPPQPEPPSPISIPGMPKGFVPTSPIPEGAPPGFVPTSPAVPPGAPLGFVPTSPAPPGAPLGFIPMSPAPPGAPLGFVPASPGFLQPPAAPPGAPPGFVPTAPAAPTGAPLGFVPTSPALPPGAPLGFVPTSPAIPPGAPPGFVPVSPVIPEGAPPGFVPVSPIAPFPPAMPASPLPQPNPAASPNMSVTGALPVLPRSSSEKSARYERAPRVTWVGSGSGSGTPRSPRVSFSGPNAGFNSRAASDWDTHSAWGEPHSTHQSPRPVRGPDLSAAIVRPGSSLSRRDSSPVIPDAATFRPSRRPSRVGFGGGADPVGVPLPASTAPSLARSQSARAPGTPAPPSFSGLPPVGLGSPFSRRLEPHPEDADEYEIVPSEDSGNTLTTPPARRHDLPPPGQTPMVSARNSLYRSPAASQRRVSMSAPADAVDGPSLHKSASRQSIASNKSYAKFDPNEYVDPAVLTSGRSRLLSLPPEEPPADEAPAATSKGKKGKGKKAKGRR